MKRLALQASFVYTYLRRGGKGRTKGDEENEKLDQKSTTIRP